MRGLGTKEAKGVQPLHFYFVVVVLTMDHSSRGMKTTHETKNFDSDKDQVPLVNNGSSEEELHMLVVDPSPR